MCGEVLILSVTNEYLPNSLQCICLPPQSGRSVLSPVLCRAVQCFLLLGKCCHISYLPGPGMIPAWTKTGMVHTLLMEEYGSLSYSSLQNSCHPQQCDRCRLSSVCHTWIIIFITKTLESLHLSHYWGWQLFCSSRWTLLHGYSNCLRYMASRLQGHLDICHSMESVTVLTILCHVCVYKNVTCFGQEFWIYIDTRQYLWYNFLDTEVCISNPQFCITAWKFCHTFGEGQSKYFYRLPMTIDTICNFIVSMQWQSQ